MNHLRLSILACLLGSAFWLPPGLAQSSAPALAEIKAAAEAGNPAAQEQLAHAFQSRLDSTNAAFWFRKAAEAGLPSAQCELGKLLLSRASMTSVTRKSVAAAEGDEGIQWLIRSAVQDHQPAQARLGAELFLGKWAKQDLVEAYKWLELAGRGPDLSTSFARNRRDTVVLKMSQEQIAEGRRRAAAFAPHQARREELPEPAWIKQLKLTGITGPVGKRLATINGRVLAEGETATIKLNGQPVAIRCLRITSDSATVTGGDHPVPRELKLLP